MSDNDLRFAILIDADNIAPKYIKIILDEVANSGVATYKRIYGDWTSQRLTSWKDCLLENSIIPMQQYSYTAGKNATDSAMIIDAMDILYSGNVDGFAIVSSDSDFTRLVARLRESGMQVIGMGEQKTPEPFISACNQFKYLDLLYASRADEGEDDAEVSDSGTAERRARRHPGDAGGARAAGAGNGGEAAGDAVNFAEMSRAARRNHMKKIRQTINAIIDKFSDDDGWVALGRVGDELAKRLPDFDVRNYGFKKLRPFLKSLGVYEFAEPESGSGQHQIYLRLREQEN
ncbi:NYN domain-containing protein [Collinsella sp. An268]|uniref:NYN domain-containing protein n=1 Tax=Collinsella sp. An268 TaxID=1965612 RepID=UPI001F12D267|nr:NYN domain-containing protein [Collinsella sp. An268]